MKRKKELHVLYIITKLELGGAQKVCLALKEGLTNCGHTSLLISGAEGPLAQKAKQIPHVYLLESFKREILFFAPWRELKNFFSLISKC